MLFLAIAAVALGWGWSVGREAVPARPGDQITAVDAAWYSGLPLEPASATAAYLARIPAGVRARGEEYSDSRLAAFGLRLLALFLATAVICFTGFTANLRDWAGRTFSRSVVIDAAVSLQYFAALYALSLPAEIYADFVRPHRFGLSDQPFVAWLGDTLVNWAVFTSFYMIAVLAIYRIIRRRPAQWVAWALGVYLVLRTVYALLAPNVIEPLTNDFHPMADGPQKQMILALARANGVNDAAIVVSDASLQSRVSNAHVSGLGGATRISIDDTTLRRNSDASLRFVMAHELGHFVLDHETAAIVTDSLVMGCGFVFVALGMRVVLGSFGARWRMSGSADIASVPVFWGLFLLWGYLSLPVSNGIARAYEHQADLFGLNASQEPGGMADFMIHDADRSRLHPTAIEYALFYDHPSDAERVATAMQWRAERTGGHER